MGSEANLTSCKRAPSLSDLVKVRVSDLLQVVLVLFSDGALAIAPMAHGIHSVGIGNSLGSNRRLKLMLVAAAEAVEPGSIGNAFRRPSPLIERSER